MRSSLIYSNCIIGQMFFIVNNTMCRLQFMLEKIFAVILYRWPTRPCGPTFKFTGALHGHVALHQARSVTSLHNFAHVAKRPVQRLVRWHTDSYTVPHYVEMVGCLLVVHRPAKPIASMTLLVRSRPTRRASRAHGAGVPVFPRAR